MSKEEKHIIMRYLHLSLIPLDTISAINNGHNFTILLIISMSISLILTYLDYKLIIKIRNTIDTVILIIGNFVCCYGAGNGGIIIEKNYFKTQSVMGLFIGLVIGILLSPIVILNMRYLQHK